MSIKKLLAALMAVSVCAVSFAACGEEEESSSSVSEPGTTTTAAITTTTPVVTTTPPVTTTVATTTAEPAEPVVLEGTDISDRLTATENADSSIYYRCGGWFMGTDNEKMATPFTYEELSQYEYLNIGYQVTYYEGEYLFPMFKVEHAETYTLADGTEAHTRTEFLCPAWMDYGPKEDSADNKGTTMNAEDVFKCDIDPSGTGMMQIPTSVLLEHMAEGEIINQFGIGHNGTIMDVGDDFNYEIVVTGVTLS
ncbi:MAG: hypothetical protein IJO29_06250 [Oscillospiraceae bacterium]|nr:hypothetical protein [Oscillospiraceae bacterium]